MSQNQLHFICFLLPRDITPNISYRVTHLFLNIVRYYFFKKYHKCKGLSETESVVAEQCLNVVVQGKNTHGGVVC